MGDGLFGAGYAGALRNDKASRTLNAENCNGGLMSSSHATPILIHEAEAAKRLGLSRDYLYRLRTSGPRRRASFGLLPPAPVHIRIGRKVLYRPADLDRWLDERASGFARVSRRRGRPTKVEQAARKRAA